MMRLSTHLLITSQFVVCAAELLLGRTLREEGFYALCMIMEANVESMAMEAVNNCVREGRDGRSHGVQIIGCSGVDPE
jgi:hypothetical protein